MKKINKKKNSNKIINTRLRDHVVFVRLTLAEYQRIAAWCAARGVQIGPWARAHLIEQARAAGASGRARDREGAR